jgi:hypothetical protein
MTMSQIGRHLDSGIVCERVWIVAGEDGRQVLEVSRSDVKAINS